MMVSFSTLKHQDNMVSFSTGTLKHLANMVSFSTGTLKHLANVVSFSTGTLKHLANMVSFSALKDQDSRFNNINVHSRQRFLCLCISTTVLNSV